MTLRSANPHRGQYRETVVTAGKLIEQNSSTDKMLLRFPVLQTYVQCLFWVAANSVEHGLLAHRTACAWHNWTSGAALPPVLLLYRGCLGSKHHTITATLCSVITFFIDPLKFHSGYFWAATSQQEYINLMERIITTNSLPVNDWFTIFIYFFQSTGCQNYILRRQKVLMDPTPINVSVTPRVWYLVSSGRLRRDQMFPGELLQSQQRMRISNFSSQSLNECWLWAGRWMISFKWNCAKLVWTLQSKCKSRTCTFKPAMSVEWIFLD